jgi:hypothetical protein
VNHADLDDGAIPDSADRFRQAFQPVANHDAHIVVAAVLDLGQRREPELDGVDEHHRIHRLQRPVAPLGHLTDHLVGDPRDGVLGHGGAVDIAKCAATSPVVNFFAVKDNTISSMPVSRRWRLLTICGSKQAIGVPRHLNLDRADLGEHRLGPRAVAGIAAAAPGRIMLVIAQMLGHLCIQRGWA